MVTRLKCDAISATKNIEKTDLIYEEGKSATAVTFFDEEKEIASLININFKEENEYTYKVISENLWNELGKSSLKIFSSIKSFKISLIIDNNLKKIKMLI